ncbi:hypothetical protein OBV_26170 [Oscillibacter valericigenes Sjm18-20]|nr:hypothetical protein OBV_26170 [Oscillibacter valericigenes Sjm18-20]
MARLRKAGAFVLIAGILLGFVALLFPSLIGDSVSVLRTGRGQARYEAVALGADDTVCAVGRDGVAWRVVFGNRNGKRSSEWKLDPLLLPDGKIAALYLDTRNLYLGLYAYGADGNVADLRLFCISDEGKTVTQLMKEPCSGDTVPEQMESARLSAFTKTEGVVSFALMCGDSSTVYAASGTESGLIEGKTYSVPGIQTALVSADGTFVAGVGGSLYWNGALLQSRKNQIMTDFTQAGTGFYYLDCAGLEVFYTDFTGPEKFQSVMKPEKDGYDLNGVTDLSLGRNGELLLLLNGGTLLLDQGSSVLNLSAMLYRSRLQCGLILGGIVLVVLLATFVLWYAVCEWRSFQLPLLLRWGVLLMSACCLVTGGVLRYDVLPSQETLADARAEQFVKSGTSLTLERLGWDNAKLPEVLAGSLASAGTDYRDVTAAVYQQNTEDEWILTASGTGGLCGTRAELTEGFDCELALSAQKDGAASGVLNWSGDGRLCRFMYQDGALLVVSVGRGAINASAQASYIQSARSAGRLTVLLLLISFVLLAWISSCLRRLAGGMQLLASGETKRRVRLRTGDELEGMSNALNSLVDTMEKMDGRQIALSLSYQRFVPKRILSLLGKESLTEVDKQTFASGRMTIMMIWFSLPPQLYEQGGRELFDNLNEVIERTASIVSQKGGTVFNFTYDGYDAVFEGGSAPAVSTAVAVQQEILAINKERESTGRPAIVLRIALDEGNLMIGIVGDELQMEPAAISPSFSVEWKLISFCNKLEANILCTEAVAKSAQEYGVRYMGKSVGGKETIRIYEIFDGDPFEVRRLKEFTQKKFSEGVYALYGRDFSRAKKIFLDLVHQNTRDGGARYYLYLADELEKHPDQEVGLRGS